MARQTKKERLTNETIAQIRSTAAKRTSALLSRLARCGLGELDMTPAQVAAAKAAISAVLPSMQQQEITDVSERGHSREEMLNMIEEQKRKIISALTPEDLAQFRQLINEDNDGKQAQH